MSFCLTGINTKFSYDEIEFLKLFKFSCNLGVELINEPVRAKIT